MSRSTAFDPLYDLDGAWTTALAERYLPLPELAGATYECDDGRLVVTPTQGAATSFGAVEVARLLSPLARAAGFVVYGRLNVVFNPDTWIEPDLTVLQCSAADQIWTAASRCTMPVEIVSHLARGRRDRIDRPAMCAAAGIPYYLRVYLNSELGARRGDLASSGHAGTRLRHDRPRAGRAGLHRRRAIRDQLRPGRSPRTQGVMQCTKLRSFCIIDA